MSKEPKQKDLPGVSTDSTAVEEMKFEPIKGYPMLHWQGKRPFTSTQFYPAQLKERYGDPVGGWMNQIFWGDNLQVMSHLLKEFRGKVDLVYIDPPYDSKADYKKRITLKGNSANNEHSAFEEKQYSDIWSSDEYLQFLYERIAISRELISEDGVIVVHSDWHKSHHIRCILDELFGSNMFVNEIVWHYYNKMQGNINRFASNHDNIFVYKKGNSFTYNKVKVKRDKPVKQIKRVWSKEGQKLVNAKDENGNIIYIEATHKAVDDVWRLSMLQPADKKEPLGYPTQKPEKLISRIVSAFSKPGDIVFDSFMGSGTTQAVALKLGRKFIGSDINLGAIQTTTKRLSSIIQEEKRQLELLTKQGQGPYLNFEVLHVNNYDIFRNQNQAKDLLVEALEIEALESTDMFDGMKDGYWVKIMPVNRIATRADLNSIITGISYRDLDRSIEREPSKPAARIMLVCMGHEADLAATLQMEIGKQYNCDVVVVDILRGKKDLAFKYDSEADITVENGEIVIRQFYPRNLLQKLSIMEENVENWQELTESVMIDWNYNGEVLQPAIIDIPGKDKLVIGKYKIPQDCGEIRVKITDLLSESLEMSLE